MNIDQAMLPYISNISTLSNSGYVRVGIKNHPFIPNKYYLLHRVTWWDFCGLEPKGLVVHHKDGNRLNNLRSNLECQSISLHQSLANLGKPKSNGLKLKGNKNAKQVTAIQREYVLRNRGLASADSIAACIGISRGTVYNIWNRESKN